MTTPTTEFNKVDGNTGVTRPAATGICALVSPCATGAAEVAAGFANREAVRSTNGNGHGLQFADYIMAQSKKNLVLVKPQTSTAAVYSAITKTGAGTATPVAGGTAPLDEYSVTIDFPAGGTVGSAGMTWRYSVNGSDYSLPQAIGTATSVTIPGTGITVSLGTGTIVAATKLTFTTTSAKMTNTDLVNSLEALRVTTQPYESILLDMVADDATVTLCNTWLQTLNKRGKFPTIVLTARARNAGESEAAYLTALSALFSPSISTDIVVCADVADNTSAVDGRTYARPAGLFVMGRGMSIPLGQDAAYVATGALPGCRITDALGNPKYHDENNFPGLDDVRITTLRTIDGFDGVYITNAKLVSSTGSDYVFWQHARTMNRGCAIAYQVLTKQLSKGVKKKREPGPNGERYIAEAEAQMLETLANAPIAAELVTPGMVDDMRVIISRTDDIRSNQGATITVYLQSVALGYVKKFSVFVSYVTAIAAPTPAAG